MKDTHEKQRSAKGVQSRRTALEVLMRIQTSGAYANIALSAALKKSQMSGRDKAFVTLLVHGVTRNRTSLDEIISRYSKKPIDQLPHVLLNTLRLSIFQLEELGDVPPSAVLNTAATIARVCGHKGMASYTTAVLRNYLRDKEQTSAREKSGKKENTRLGSDETNKPSEQATNSSTLATKYSMPEWLIERWLKNYGVDETLELLKFSTSEPRLVLRANEQAITTEGLLAILTNAGAKVTSSALVPSCLVLESKGDPAKLPGYSEGMFSIQDDAAALIAKIVDPKPGETILDLCAAPGGKALFIAELMENSGRVIALDKQANRLELLKKNRQRLGLTNVEIVVADGRTYEQSQLVDRILIDAPCSSTGVLNRKTDLRYKLTPESLSTLSKLQFDLANNAAGLLKPGGVLVYATCSVEPEENDRMIDRFLSDNIDFKLDDLTPFVPQPFINAVEKSGSTKRSLSDSLRSGKLQILPSMMGLSGFFVARLLKPACSRIISGSEL